MPQTHLSGTRPPQDDAGRVFSTGGDSVLAEFGSAVEAVRCAISIQEEISSRNAELGVDRKLTFRIGINVGDVMVRDDDLFGDGVNVAARLEGLAEAGGVCVSSSVFEQIKHKLSLGFEDMGPPSVKNLPEPISAYRLVAGSDRVVQSSHAWSGLAFVHYVASTRDLPGVSVPYSKKLSIEAAQKAVSLDPKSAEAHWVTGLGYTRNGQPDRGLASCNTALDLNPNNDCAHICASLTNMALGKAVEALPFSNNRSG